MSYSIFPWGYCQLVWRMHIVAILAEQHELSCAKNIQSRHRILMEMEHERCQQSESIEIIGLINGSMRSWNAIEILPKKRLAMIKMRDYTKKLLLSIAFIRILCVLHLK